MVQKQLVLDIMVQEQLVLDHKSCPKSKKKASNVSLLASFIDAYASPRLSQQNMLPCKSSGLIGLFADVSYSPDDGMKCMHCSRSQANIILACTILIDLAFQILSTTVGQYILTGSQDASDCALCIYFHILLLQQICVENLLH